MLRQLLTDFMIWVLYPVWLLAGATDYVCHRLTDISRTSGVKESLLHLAQFATLLCLILVAVFMQITAAALVLMLALVTLHSLLAALDVAYTDGLRYISPLEQTVHGFLDVLPWVAVGLIAVLNWPSISEGPRHFFWTDAPVASPDLLLVLGSYVLLAGLPIGEEFLRTWRHREERPATAEEAVS